MEFQEYGVDDAINQLTWFAVTKGALPVSVRRDFIWEIVALAENH